MPNNKKKTLKKSAKQAPNITAETVKPQHSKEHVMLSNQAHEYSKAVADPFGSKPCGIPSFPSLPSLKVKTWAKGTFQTSGTTGFGFIAVDPRAAVVNDTDSVMYSTSAYAHSHVRNTGLGSVSAATNAPYTTAQISAAADALSYRVVASGLRIRYIGTELNRGGYKIGLRDPTGSTLADRNIPAFEAETQAVRFSVDRKWTTITYQPWQSNLLEFAQSLGVGGSVPDAATVVAPSRQFWMGFAVQAAEATTSLAYEFEFYTIVEYQGSISTGQTVTMHDPVGHAAVGATLVNSKALQPTQLSSAERVSSTLEHVSHYVKHGISSYQAVSQVASDVGRVIRPSTAGSSSWWNTALNWVEAILPAIALL
jgi:hypothetical protein